MGLLGTEELLSMAIADEVVAVSEATTRAYPWIRQVIPCGVALTTFGAAAKWSRERDPTILFVGTYRNRKRGWLLADAFARAVQPALPDARLWMVCDDAPQTPGVEVFGRVPETTLVELYQRAWVFCLPSTYEGFGVPYLEALATGCPVVATPNAGAREILRDGVFGRIVDAEQLGGALLELLQDEALRADLAARGRVRAKRFDWSRIADEYEALYYTLV
jgi:glycosyltransferase involved in cell wall biosynthesis